ncbi:MAG TPA: hypothetical protein VHO00_03230, partial [Actinomycetes bacterium]|nr:hypothetical protein [Actinomycetes bacterium]
MSDRSIPTSRAYPPKPGGPHRLVQAHDRGPVLAPVGHDTGPSSRALTTTYPGSVVAQCTIEDRW